MRRDEIKIGVEYCETAPHAYGNEPRVAAYKVKFTDTVPRLMLVHYKWDPNGGPLQTGMLVEDRMEYVTFEQALAYETDRGRSFRVASERRQPVSLIKHFDYQDGLPAIRCTTRNGVEYWHPTLVRPAAVHRTWEEHLAKQAKAEASALAAKKARAPAAFESDLRSVVQWAQFMGYSLVGVQDRLGAEWIRQQRE